MAYDVTFYGTFDGRTNHRLKMYNRRSATSGNSSAYAWDLDAQRTSGVRSWIYDGQPWSAYVGGFKWSGSAGLPFDTATVNIASGVSGYIAHNADGYLNIWVDGQMTAGGFGYAMAGGTHVTDRIPKAPDKPVKSRINSVDVDEVNLTIFAPDNNGSAITTYNQEIRTGSGSTGTLLQAWNSGSSTQIRTALPSGSKLYHRYRAVNGVGTSTWSDSSEFTTKSGAMRGTSGSFQPSEVLIGSGGSYKAAEIWVANDLQENFINISGVIPAPTLVDMDHVSGSTTSVKAFVADMSDLATHIEVRWCSGSKNNITEPDGSQVFPWNGSEVYTVTGLPAGPKTLYFQARSIDFYNEIPGFWSEDIITVTWT